ncbi:redoxin domain-containing protein [Bdellovibrio bacteriovorus]|uniref:redoxin domain-containing protein n=1 Tax=Bdellovibrio bacteriovorus TaxID=959 RepID=UPI0021D3CC30|nr:redoxin domain-containing protein [Bdellovibrio bacteriovorus]UXR65323.1 redoxin domain-containing protein [Bdellovibrio bacteriovorus]
MKHIVLALALGLSANFAFADAKIGSPAPDFAVADAQGKTHKLSDFKGKYVVLEWYNKDCPYVRKHYDSKNMQKIQTEMTGKGIVWLSVISSAPGKQGYLAAVDAAKNGEKEGTKATAILIDDSGKMGKAYGAKTTPHMYLIDPQGVLRYNGAIDSNDSADPKTIASAENYIIHAVASAEKGEKIAKETSKPYGCSVKY